MAAGAELGGGSPAPGGGHVPLQEGEAGQWAQAGAGFLGLGGELRSGRWALGTECQAGLVAQAASLWGSAWAGEPPLCLSELGGAMLWLSISHTQQTSMHMYTYPYMCIRAHTRISTTNTHTPTCTSHSAPAVGPCRTQELLSVPTWPQVTYLPFTEAFDQAKAKNKLVHSILLWGALDDQSC